MFFAVVDLPVNRPKTTITKAMLGDHIVRKAATAAISPPTIERFRQPIISENGETDTTAIITIQDNAVIAMESLVQLCISNFKTFMD